MVAVVVVLGTGLDFAEAVSVVAVLGFGPGLAVVAGDCLVLTEEALVLGLGLALAGVAEAKAGFEVVFFFGASDVLSADDLDVSLSSFLGEGGFFTELPFLETLLSPVALPLASALIFSAPAAFTLLLSLTLGLFVELPVLVGSVF